MHIICGRFCAAHYTNSGEMTKGNFRRILFWTLRDIAVYWRTLVLILVPILLAPLPAVIKTKASRGAYVMILTAVYWVAEVAPLPVTGLLPIVLFPLFDVMSTEETCMWYLKDTNFVFMAGLIVAVALEESNLHKRIALRVLLWMGDEPRWLMLGFMGTTAFLSMWMSNTAATAMMLPIAVVILDILVRNALLDELELKAASRKEGSSIIELPSPDAKVPAKKKGRPNSPKTIRSPKSEKERPSPKRHLAPLKDSSIIVADHQRTIPDFDSLPPNLQGLCKATLLCIAYGASLGGTATLTGTGPNLVFASTVEQKNLTGIDFGTWTLACTPSMILCVAFGWAWLVVYFMGFRALVVGCCRRKKEKEKVSNVRRALMQRYRELGRVSFAEGSMIFWLIVLIMLWVFRKPVFMKGWDDLFRLKKKYSHDACAGMLIAFILFIYPSQKPDFICCRRDKSKKPKLRKSLMTWTHMQNKFPWGIIVLLGGGFAMAEGSEKSCLSDWITRTLQAHMKRHRVNKVGVAALIVTLVTFFTEVASNSATASIFTPIAMDLAKALEVNPLYLGVPATIAASFAFMLPLATPPNALVYETKLIKLKDLVVAGLVMNILCIVVTMISVHTWSYAIFNFGTVPVNFTSDDAKNATQCT